MQVSAQGCVKCGIPHCGERCLETIADEEDWIESLVQERVAQRLQAIAEEEARIEALVQERVAQRLQAIAEEEAAIKENHAAASLEEHDEELQIEENETCDLIGKKASFL